MYKKKMLAVTFVLLKVNQALPEIMPCSMYQVSVDRYSR